MKILYLTLFESVTENGIYETQVKRFLCRLADRYGDNIALSHIAFLPALVISRTGVFLSFLDGNGGNAGVRSEYRHHGVDCRLAYVPIPVLKRWKSNISLPLLLFVLIAASPILLYQILRRPVEIVHCRSYVAALLALGMKLIFPRLKVIFDPRGFYPEEGVVTGKWSVGSLTFKCWKGLERILVGRCDAVIALSEPFAERVRLINPGAACAVIHASADVERFTGARECGEIARKELGLEGNIVFVYTVVLEPGTIRSCWREFTRRSAACVRIRGWLSSHSTMSIACGRSFLMPGSPASTFESFLRNRRACPATL